MKFNDLNISSHKQSRRVGRGIAAGRGKTAGRGTKGQNARGSGTRPGFEGGQNPLMQRLPKLRGFTSHRPKTFNVYTGQLDKIGGTVDNFTLVNAGIIDSPYVRVKLVTKGDVTTKVAVHLQGATQSAIASVQKAGGSFTKTPQVKRQGKQTNEQE